MKWAKASVFSGYTPLLMAAAIGNEEIARILIEKGANVNATNDNGDSALTLAAMTSKNYWWRNRNFAHFFPVMT